MALPFVDESEWYGYRIHPHRFFYAELCTLLPKLPGLRFLEVGAGVGTKLRLARQLGLDAHGIELRSEYAVLAGTSVEVADARTWQGYGEYDLVYANRVAVQDKLQLEVERQILKHMRRGAFLWALDWITELSWELVFPHVWKR